MKPSHAALAALILAGGTAVGFATGTRVTPDSGDEERVAVTELAALIEDQKRIVDSLSERETMLDKRLDAFRENEERLTSWNEELGTRQADAERTEAELLNKTKAIEEKLASLQSLENDLALKNAQLQSSSQSLSAQQNDIQEKSELLEAKLALIAQLENQLNEREQDLQVLKSAINSPNLDENTESKFDNLTDEFVARAANEPAISPLELLPVSHADQKVDGIAPEKIPELQAGSVEGSVVPEPTPLNNGPIAEVHFESNSAQLTPGALQRAREAADRVRDMKFSKIRIAGHSDTTGSASRNRALSRERAEAVADIFVQSGLSRQMIEIVGFGEAYEMLPISTGDGISEPLNRCVGIFVEEIDQTALK